MGGAGSVDLLGEGTVGGEEPAREGSLPGHSFGPELDRTGVITVGDATVVSSAPSDATPHSSNGDWDERIARREALTAALSNAIRRDHVARVSVEGAVAVMGALGGTLYLASEDEQTLHAVASAGAGEEDVGLASSWPVASELPWSQAFRSGAPVWIADLADLEALRAGGAIVAALSSAGRGALAAVPIKSGARVLGVLTLGWSRLPSHERDRACLGAIALELGQALDRAFLAEAERQARLEADASAERIQILAEVARTMVTEGRALPAVLDAVAALLAGRVGDACTVWLVAEGAVEVAPIAHRSALDGGRADAGDGAAQPAERTLVAKVVLAGKTHESPDRRRAVAPIQVKQRVLGALEVTRVPGARAFDAADRSLLEQVAARLALFVDNVRLVEREREARRRAERAATRAALLQTVTADLSRAASPVAVAQVLIARAEPALGATAAAFSVLGEDGVTLALLDTVGLPESARRVLRTLSSTVAHPMAEAARTRRPLFFERGAAVAAAYPGFRADELGPPAGALAALPLLTGEHCLGVLAMRFAGEHRFDVDEITFLDLLASHAAQALDRARLYEQERAAREAAESAATRVRRLQALTAALAETTTAREVGAIAVERCLEATAARDARLYIGDGRGPLRLLARHGEAGAPVDLMVPLDGKLPLSQVVRTQAGLYFHTANEVRARYADSATFDVEVSPGQGQAYVPLLCKGQAIGALALGFDEVKRFGQTDRTFIEALARQCAQAIDRVRLLETERRAHERARFLAEASQILSSSLDGDAISRDLVRLAVPRVGDWCAIELVDEEGKGRQVAVAHQDPGRGELAWEVRRRYTDDPFGKSVLSVVLRTGRPVVLSSVDDVRLEAMAADEDQLRLLRALGLRSLACVPVMAGGKVQGSLTLGRAGEVGGYGVAELELLQDLAHRVGLAFENARLYRELKAAVEVRDDFLAVAGHELRNPLTALLMYAQSLERMAHRDRTDERIPERLAKVSTAAHRLERLINELLDVSRITGGRLRLEPEPVDLGVLVREVVTRFADAATEAGCALVTDFATGVVGRWDLPRIDQVVSNLLSNAIKYGRGYPVEVRVSAEDGWALLSVADHGIGIPPGEQKRIFERFERAVSHREFGGFGLGLWIARQIVEASGGRIEVRSAAGEGATFTVRLPLEPTRAGSVGAA